MKSASLMRSHYSPSPTGPSPELPASLASDGACAWDRSTGRLGAAAVPGRFGPISYAIAAVPHGMLVFTPAGTVVAANRGSSAIFGYAPDEMLEQPITRLLPG